MKEFPVGSVVFFNSHKELLMTVVGYAGDGSTGPLKNDSPDVKVIWFDDEKHLQATRASPESLCMRIKKKPE